MGNGLNPDGSGAAGGTGGGTAPAATSLEDAFNGYRLFLGRNPATIQEVTAATGCTLPEFLGSYLMRGEFLSVVEGLDGILPHVTLAPEPDEGLMRWALMRLPLSEEAKARLSTSRSWRFWLLTILCDETFLATLPTAVAGWLTSSGLGNRLSAIELAPTRRLIGELSNSRAGTVSGWCANASDFSERIVLELTLGGRFIGAVRCECFVPGLGERIGSGGEHGFSFDIPAAYADLAARGAMLRVCDAHSKAPFGGEIYIKTNLPVALDELGRILDAIKSVKDLLANLEQQLPHTLRAINPPLSAYDGLKAQGLLACHRPPAAQAIGAADAAVNLILWDHGLTPARLRRLLASLDEQTHGRWMLTLLADEGGLADEVRLLLRPLEATHRLVTAAPATLPRLIAGHPALAAARAHLVVGRAGLLRPDALAAFLGALETGTAAVAYSDHDVAIGGHGGKPPRLVPVFKPDFDPVMLLSYEYLGPIVMVTPEALLKAFAVADGKPPSGPHDLMLRLADCVTPDGFRHIASVLYSLEQPADFRSPDGLPWLLTGEPEAVESWAGRRGLDMRARRSQLVGKDRDADHTLVDACEIALSTTDLPPVSVIVPTRNSPVLLRNNLDSLLRTRQAYAGSMQILVIDHENEDPDSVGLIAAMRDQRGIDVMPYRGPFNWALMNTLAAARASGTVLAFLNDDTLATDPLWLTRAVATLGLPGVGVVGGCLLYGDGSVQHAGMVTSREQGAVHEAVGARGDDGGYLGRNLVLRSAAAVTGACLITRRPVFEAVGGFDAGWPLTWNDVIYCLAARKAGWRVVYDPKVRLYHHEAKTRGHPVGPIAWDVHQGELRRLRAEWGEDLADPFYNPAFNRTTEPFTRLAL